MGRDTDAVTIVGVKIAVAQFGENCADCELCDGEFLSCEGCLAELTKEIRKEINTSSGWCHLGPYEIYHEVHDNDRVNSHIYICIYKGVKSESETEVLCPLTLEELACEREKLALYLHRLGLTDFAFGIFTLLTITY